LAIWRFDGGAGLRSAGISGPGKTCSLRETIPFLTALPPRACGLCDRRFFVTFTTAFKDQERSSSALDDTAVLIAPGEPSQPAQEAVTASGKKPLLVPAHPAQRAAEVFSHRVASA